MISPFSLPAVLRIRDDEFVLYLSTEQLRTRIMELAARIDRDMQGKEAVFLCLLNGAFIFCADLLRCLTIDCEVEFLKLSSYGEENISSGDVRLVKDLCMDVENRHVVIVEDIVDTGYSIDFVKKHLEKKNPASLKIVTLLHKPACTRIAHELDYVGFEIPPRFVVGFGLDYARKARNIPAIYISKSDAITYE